MLGSEATRGFYSKIAVHLLFWIHLLACISTRSSCINLFYNSSVLTHAWCPPSPIEHNARRQRAASDTERGERATKTCTLLVKAANCLEKHCTPRQRLCCTHRALCFPAAFLQERTATPPAPQPAVSHHITNSEPAPRAGTASATVAVQAVPFLQSLHLLLEPPLIYSDL